MPARTNEKQQVIEMVKRLHAPPDARITASKMLRDSLTGTPREVDVVVEHDFDGHTWIQSFEVTGRERP